MKRVLFVTNIPSPYRVHFFDLLAKHMDVTVVFHDNRKAHTGREDIWFGVGDGSFHQVQLEKCVLTKGEDSLCLDVIDWLKKPYDEIVICGYSSPTAMLAIAWLRMKRIPFWMEVDGGLIREESKLKYLYKKLLVSSADKWISSGKETTKYLTHYGAKEKNIFHYPFSSVFQQDIAVAIPSLEEKRILRQAKNMPEEKVLLYVGRFTPEKGMDDLLAASVLLDKSVGVYFIGGQPSQEHITFCKENQLENVHFVGFQTKEQLEGYYRAADLLVLPTWSDVWGLVINEAMAYGLPVVTTDKCVAGMELIENGVNGYIVPIQNPELLAQAIEKVLSSDLQQMGTASLERICPYTIENMVKTHIAIFENRR